MIGLYFNEGGYYITGNGIEAAWSCSPALTESGAPIFLPTHHLYGVLYRALHQLNNFQTMEDVIVYNDSRLIEEINGAITPLDNTHKRWLNILRRRLLPNLRSNVLFRKKAPAFITQHIKRGHDTLINSVDRAARQRALQQQRHQDEELEKNRRLAVLKKFKRNWNNGYR